MKRPLAFSVASPDLVTGCLAPGPAEIAPRGGSGAPRVGRRSWQDRDMESARLDQWLWAVRIYKTRSSAAAACRSGQVRLNGSPAKASAVLRVGDRVAARLDGGDRLLEVTQVIAKRVGAPEAASCVVDHSPPLRGRDDTVLRRQPGAGRPTKKDRRALDRLRR